uniref:Uncharacterized protein n=1 Tax=Anopheles merus TaxID=30066 RepID=A0A182V003_ANOME
MTKVFLDGMIKRKRGHIIGISSMSGMYAFPWGVVYSATKFAVSGFMASLTEQLRIQGLSKSVRTTCVNPYYVTTRKDVIEFLQKPRFFPVPVQQLVRDYLIREYELNNNLHMAALSQFGYDGQRDGSTPAGYWAAG